METSSKMSSGPSRSPQVGSGGVRRGRGGVLQSEDYDIRSEVNTEATKHNLQHHMYHQYIYIDHVGYQTLFYRLFTRLFHAKKRS